MSNLDFPIEVLREKRRQIMTEEDFTPASAEMNNNLTEAIKVLSRE
jgi:hypothetical protein